MPQDTTSDSNRADRILSTRRSTLFGLGLLSAGTVTSGVLEGDNGKGQPKAPQSKPIPSRESDGGVSASIDEVLPGDKFGKLQIGQYSHSLQVSGTRRPAWMVQPFSEDVTTTSTSYEETGSNVGYGSIPFPPGQVPVLRTTTHFDSDEDTTTSLRISVANRPVIVDPAQGPVPADRDPVQQTLLEVCGRGTTQVYGETYLTDHEDIVSGFTNGTQRPENTFILEVKTDDPTQEATIRNTTTISLELEAL